MEHHSLGRIFEVDKNSFQQEIDCYGNLSTEWVFEAERVNITAVKDITPEYAMSAGVQIFSFKSGATEEEIKQFKIEEWKQITSNFKSDKNPDGKWSPDNQAHLQECTQQYFSY